MAFSSSSGAALAGQFPPLRVSRGLLEYQTKDTTNHEEWTILDSPKGGEFNVVRIEFSDVVTVTMRCVILIVKSHSQRNSNSAQKATRSDRLYLDAAVG